MKKLMLVLVLVLVITNFNVAVADIIPGGVKPGFMGNSVIQIKRIGEETCLEEFVFPSDQSADRTMELNCHLTLTAKLDEVRFTGAESGDSWWKISATIRQEADRNYLIISIEGKWNPVEQGADRWGRSSVVKIKLVPLTAKNSVLFQNDLWDIDLTRQIDTISITDVLPNKVNKQLGRNPRDFNGDGRVDIYDQVALHQGDKRRRQAAIALDLNKDGRVDIWDLVLKAEQEKKVNAAPSRPGRSHITTTWSRIKQ